jgi:hypothetical protein
MSGRAFGFGAEPDTSLEMLLVIFIVTSDAASKGLQPSSPLKSTDRQVGWTVFSTVVSVTNVLL